MPHKSEYKAYRTRDLVQVVRRFEQKHQPDDRYASFDYCYNYFHPSSKNDLTADMEKSCLALGFYLASWGMFRGSSFLLKGSSKGFIPLVEYVAELPVNAWKIDAHNYNDDKIGYLIEIYDNLKEKLIAGENAHLTLITKIMLGVFGSVPAFDRFFIDTFGDLFRGHCGFTRFNRKSLESIHMFYLANETDIERIASQAKTFNFRTGRKSRLRYTRSKVIDMYGFTKGLE